MVIRHPNRGASLRKNLMSTRAHTKGHYQENQCWYCLPGNPKKYIQDIEIIEEVDGDKK